MRATLIALCIMCVLVVEVHGQDINARDEHCNTLLHKAVSIDPDTAIYLIEKGADVHAKNDGGNTPLHAAAFHGNPVVARALIDAGAKVNARANNGYTPLHSAIPLIQFESRFNNGRIAVMRALIDAGAKVNAVVGYKFLISPDRLTIKPLSV